MVNLLDLPEDAIGLIGECIVLHSLAVNTESQTLVSNLAPRAEPIWRNWCEKNGLCSSPANGEPWRKWFVLCAQRLRQAVISGDLVRGVRSTVLIENFREVPTDILRDALMNNDDKLELLRTLLKFRTAPDAANDLGEALVAHASESSVQSFRAIAHHLQRWNIKITALHYSQAASQVREQGSSHLSHDFRKVPAPDAV